MLERPSKLRMMGFPLTMQWSGRTRLDRPCRLAVALCLASLVACGGRTGLSSVEADPADASPVFDAAPVDASDVFDAIAVDVFDASEGRPRGESGTLDTSFGSGGLALEPVLNEPAGARVVDIVVTGSRIVIAANLRYGTEDEGRVKATLIGFDEDGSLDASFGSDGFTILDPGSPEFFASELGVNRAGQIVAVGTMREGLGSSAGAARAHADGQLDPTFGEEGFFFMPIVPNAPMVSSQGFAMLVGPDDSIFIGGGIDPHPHGDVTDKGLILKLSADGRVDTTFGTMGLLQVGGGSVISNPSGSIQELHARPEGGFMVAGEFRTLDPDPYPRGGLLIAFDFNGDPDPTFGEAGVAEADAFHRSTHSLGVQSTGSSILWAAGHLLRFSSGGTHDTSFGTSYRGAGWADLPSSIRGQTMSVAPDDFIYVAGTSGGLSLTDSTTAQLGRLTPDSVDRGFLTQVSLSEWGRTGSLFPSAIEPIEDDTVVMAGTYHDADEEGIFVVRIWQ